MKRQGYIPRTMILGMFILLSVGIGQAQYEGQVVKVKIPFNFNVGAKTFSAGEYSLKPLLPNTMLLRNQAGQVLTSIATNSVESREASSSVKLVFNGYAGSYFLAQIWQPGNNVGREVFKSRVETEMARKYSPEQQIALQMVAHR